MCKNHSYPQSYSCWNKKITAVNQEKKIKKLNHKQRTGILQNIDSNKGIDAQKLNQKIEPTKADWLYRRTRREELGRREELSRRSSIPPSSRRRCLPFSSLPRSLPSPDLFSPPSSRSRRCWKPPPPSLPRSLPPTTPQHSTPHTRFVLFVLFEMKIFIKYEYF